MKTQTHSAAYDFFRLFVAVATLDSLLFVAVLKFKGLPGSVIAIVSWIAIVGPFLLFLIPAARSLMRRDWRAALLQAVVGTMLAFGIIWIIGMVGAIASGATNAAVQTLVRPTAAC